MKTPWVCVEPDPGSMTDCHMADHALLVVRVNSPGMCVDQTDQRFVLHCLVADPQRELSDGAVGRCQQLRLVELPMQIGDFSADRRHRCLMQSQGLLRF